LNEHSLSRDAYLRLIEVAGHRHDEAVKCAGAGAWIAASALLGAAIEGVLLVTASNAEADLRARGLWPKGDPLDWNLGDLVRLGIAAGWFDGEDVNPPDASLSEAINSTRILRNLMHPGAFVRDVEPGADVTEDVCRAVFSVLDAVYAVSLANGDPARDAPSEIA